MFGMFIEVCSSEVSTFTFLGRSNVAVIICGPTSVGSSCRVYSQPLADHTWHPVIFPQILATFCSVYALTYIFCGCTLWSRQWWARKQAQKGFSNVTDILKRYSVWVVESGFAGPIIVLVQEFEENFSTKPGFPKQTWGSCQFWNLHRNCLLSSWHIVDAEKSWFPRENHLQYISVDWRATEAASRWSSKEFDALRLGLWRFVYWIPGGDCWAMATGLERCVVLLGRVWILRRSAKWAFHKKQFMGQAQIYRCYSISSIPTHGYTWENVADSFIVLQAGV